MQHLEEFRDYCLSLKAVSESTPFGPDTLVFKVMNKMFALTGLESDDFKVNLKCNPEWAVQLRSESEYIQPGYHQNKKHWNTVDFKHIPEMQKKLLILHSYELVIATFTKAEKIAFNSLNE
ncbi:MAG: MmcQ/YjbR family DNA-binding protein [Pseudarcicella sp.]|nr:MmcQ/YjbR family DNA-binding protein [Pseudarcicella sp.]